MKAIITIQQHQQPRQHQPGTGLSVVYSSKFVLD
jgi:hypothetical protein